MTVYIKASGALPESEIEYAAWQGFSQLGMHTEFFRTREDIASCGREDLIVGGISTVIGQLERFGIQIPDLDYPPQLEPLLGRRIWTDRLDRVLAGAKRPVFVKPLHNKMFIGFVLYDDADLPRLRQTKPDEPVLCSEVVEFRSEWRAFVRYGSIWDVRPYGGDWRHPYDPDVLERAVDAFTDDPAGYAMDFGVTEDGRTVLIEVNDGFGLGCYGADPMQYAKLLSARWCELTGIPDPCDLFLERTDWKKRKRTSD